MKKTGVRCRRTCNEVCQTSKERAVRHRPRSLCWCSQCRPPAIDVAANSFQVIMASNDATDMPDKDLPLRDDIRRLGRILGDTVREQQGTRPTRWSSASARRRSASTVTRTIAARRELESTLNSLSRSQSQKHHSGLQLLFAPGQHRGRPASYPSHARACLGSFGAARRDDGPCDGASLRNRSVPRRAAGLLRVCANHPGAHRSSDRSAAQEHHRSRDGDRRNCSRIAIAPRSRPRNSRPMTRRCAAPCLLFGKPTFCAAPSSPSSTR